MPARWWDYVTALTVKLGPLELRNPFMAASGTFGFGEEYGELIDINALGALMVKGLTLKPKTGNPPPRVVETPAGMLNAIGLHNPGLDRFLNQELPRLAFQKTPVIVNINGETEDDFVTLARELSGVPSIIALELNVSCPNVKKGGIAFGTSVPVLTSLVEQVKSVCHIPLMVKLSPNVTDIREMALAAEEGGADMLSLVNTLKGMVIDTGSRRPFLGNITGGLSGPAIRPVAVRMVYEVFSATSLPLVGMGGVFSLDDALQFFLAGASAVAVGTGNFVMPDVIPRLVSDLHNYLQKEGIDSPSKLVGLAHGETE